MTLLLIYVAVALGFSFICSVLEAVLLSITPAYVGTLNEKRPALATTLRKLKEDVDRPLAAILSLNTIAHTVGAVGVGAEAQKLWGSEVLTIASAVLTLLVLFLSEIIPKTLGAVYWRRLAPLAAWLLPPLIWVLFPLVWVSQLMSGMFSAGKKKGRTVLPEEIAAMAQLGFKAGTVEELEGNIVRNLFRLGDVRVRDIMTPRTVVFTLEATRTVASVLDEHSKLPFSRIPLWSEDPHNVVGYVRRDALLDAGRKEGEREIGELMTPILVVPETLTVWRLFERLIDEREHITVVIDEFGSVAGLATMEDVLETLLGLEIVDEVDPVPDMRALARQRWEERAQRLGIPVESVADESGESDG